VSPGAPPVYRLGRRSLHERPVPAQAGRADGEGKYYDDAARQVVNFHRYLTDPATSLCHHAYYAFSDRVLPSLGAGERMDRLGPHGGSAPLPKNHPSFAEITKLFRRHMKASFGFRAGRTLAPDPG